MVMARHPALNTHSSPNQYRVSHYCSKTHVFCYYPLWPLQLCRTFATTGSCPYGSRCRFIHSTSAGGGGTPGSGGSSGGGGGTSLSAPLNATNFSSGGHVLGGNLSVGNSPGPGAVPSDMLEGVSSFDDYKASRIWWGVGL